MCHLVFILSRKWIKRRKEGTKVNLLSRGALGCQSFWIHVISIWRVAFTSSVRDPANQRLYDTVTDTLTARPAKAPHQAKQQPQSYTSQ